MFPAIFPPLIKPGGKKLGTKPELNLLLTTLAFKKPGFPIKSRLSSTILEPRLPASAILSFGLTPKLILLTGSPSLEEVSVIAFSKSGGRLVNISNFFLPAFNFLPIGRRSFSFNELNCFIYSSAPPRIVGIIVPSQSYIFFLT